MATLQRSVNVNPTPAEDNSWGYDVGMDGDADDSESVMTDLLSPGGQTDAQTLACMLQVVSSVCQFGLFVNCFKRQGLHIE